MTNRALVSPTTCFRISDNRYPIMSPVGASMHGARWNLVGTEVIYAASNYAEALLERIVHWGGASVPVSESYVQIDLPRGLVVSEFEEGDIPNWMTSTSETAAYGSDWVDSQGAVVLIVPGIVGRPHHRNILINPNHPDYRLITTSAPHPVIWDPRLFRR